MKYKIEYQQYPDGSHVCIAYENGDWFCDCGLESDTAEVNAALLLMRLNAGEEAIANARLIAAAPEMLRVIQDALTSIDSGESIIACDLEAVIIKATGSRHPYKTNNNQ